MRTRLFAVSVLLVAMGGLAACGGSDSEAPASEPTSTDAPKASDAPAASGECVYTKSDDAAKDAKLPPTTPESAKSLTIATNRGDIEATLKPETAPCTVNSFVSLAKQGYFDDTKCHRLVVDFVLQCGDPEASGRGGPGYTYADELKGDETYPAGTLAMANSGPDTNGSQFFIVLADATLPASYTVFGSVDDAGLKVAQKIAEDGNGADGVSPAKDVVIKSVS